MPTAVYASATFAARPSLVERFLGWLTRFATTDDGSSFGRDLAVYHSMYRGF